MTIQDIYQKYQIPPNLQLHQLEVTAVGRYLCDHWKLAKIDKRLVTEALLLHDMGNIIKFKRPFLGELEKDAKHWEEVQQEYIQNYGTDVHSATQTIVREIGVSDAVSQLLDGIGMDGVGKSEEALIADYADMCVSPAGIVGFEQRMADLLRRYDLNGDEKGISMRRKNAKLVEQSVDVDLTKIHDYDFIEEIEILKVLQI